MAKRIAIAFVLICGLCAASFQFYGAFKESRKFASELDTLKEEAEAINSDNRKIEDKINYLGRADNLINELKAKFNYRLPEEKMIIVAPKEKGE